MKVLGLGNALVDILVKLESDKLLEDFFLPKGSMQLVDAKVSEKVLQAVSKYDKQQASGGSAANTIHGIARLGGETGYIGTINNDALGNFFKTDLEKSKIKPFLKYGDANTGKAVTLISPDSERTFATFLGAAVELSPDQFEENIFKAYDILHLEGYLVFNHDLLNKAGEIAKANNMLISLDLASYNVIDANLDFLKSYVEKYVDIVFANEEEAKSFTGKEPLNALEDIAKVSKIAVVKVGSQGSHILSNGEKHQVGVIKCNPIDTTGAGDLYAGGFLYGLTKNLSLDKCGKIGALLAGKVIEVIGAKIPDDTWKEIQETIKEIIAE